MLLAKKNLEITIDLLRLTSAVESLERECLAEEKDGTLRPTVEFLRKLASWLHVSGLENASSSDAWTIWKALGPISRSYRDQYAQQAKLAFWYKLNPFELSGEQQIGLLANLTAVQCQERLHRPDFDPTDYELIYWLYLHAYGDEKLAMDMKVKAYEAYVRKTTKPSS